MDKILKQELVTAPDGTQYKVSTVRTRAGGATYGDAAKTFFELSSLAATLTSWPYETMIFGLLSLSGLHHCPHASKVAALVHHKKMVDMVKRGLEFRSGVVNGGPAMSPEEWLAKHPQPGA